MTRPSTEIWLFHPVGQGVGGGFKIIEEECRRRGWKFSLRQPRKSSLLGGRVRWLIKSEDASNLYRRLHRACVGVLQIGKVHISLVSERRPIARDFRTLREFVLHKAFHSTMQDKNFLHDWRSFLDKFQVWLRQASCDGEGDPRCLPFHMFETELDLDVLSLKEGRSHFNEIHGPQSNRVDSNGSIWNRPRGQFHGRGTLYVAGRELAKGFHWDVSSSRAPRRIFTTSEIWEIGRGGYLNIYPDQYVRGGSRSRQIAPKKKARR